MHKHKETGMGSMAGKVAIITGAASQKGFGFATARLFAQEGAKVVLTDVSGQAVDARAAELRASRFDAIAIHHDVTSETSWNAVMETTLRTFGRVHVLVNNAGIAPLGSILTTPLATWNEVIAINLTSVFLGCQVVLRQLVLQKEGGSVINISSTAGISALPNVAAYTASKGGVRMLTKAAALDVASEGIRVNSVHPGQMNTEMSIRSTAADPSLIKAIEASIPMERIGEALDIANMNLFLASDKSIYITGSEFVVDGGSTAGRKGR
jgi:NAD(P)-dependent dehydrogenase (short-subunit alcohol dehydrogenase family)